MVKQIKLNQKKPATRKEQIHLCSLQREHSGFTITVRIGPYKYTIYSVPENIIRCALGDDDMTYLLGGQSNPAWQEGDDPEDQFIIPGRDEGLTFGLSPKAFKDCMKHGDPQRDLTGRMDAHWV